MLAARKLLRHLLMRSRRSLALGRLKNEAIWVVLMTMILNFSTTCVIYWEGVVSHGNGNGDRRP